MLARARAIHNAAEARALYHDWAATYDADIFDTLKVTGSDRIADLLAAHLTAREADIIDLGCGTGHVGARLRGHGFATIDGVDLSPEMLEVARGKQLYRNLMAADLNEPLSLASGSYDAAISAGAFTTGHVGAGALDEVLRIVRPGGLVAATIADSVWHAGGFDAAVAKLARTGGITLLSTTHEPIVAGGERQGRFIVARAGDQAAASP
jgi:predicted TPR repeat methyltransferase